MMHWSCGRNPFGPIAVLNAIDTIDEGIKKANSVPYGLAAYGFTHAAANVDKLIDGIEAGNLSINTLEASLPETPFGGVKSSGYGREGGEEGLHHYTVVKNVSPQHEGGLTAKIDDVLKAAGRSFRKPVLWQLSLLQSAQASGGEHGRQPARAIPANTCHVRLVFPLVL